MAAGERALVSVGLWNRLILSPSGSLQSALSLLPSLLVFWRVGSRAES